MEDVTTSPSRPRFHLRMRWAVLVVFIIMLVVGGAVLWSRHNHKLAQEKKVQQAQKTYQSTLDNVQKYQMQGDPGKSVSELQRYLETKHTEEQTYQATVALAYSYAVQGFKDQAFTTLQKAETIMPAGTSDAFLHGNLGDAYAARGEKNQAVIEYQKAIADAKKDKNYTTTPYADEYQKKLDALETTSE